MRIVDRRGENTDVRPSEARRALERMRGSIAAVHDFLNHVGSASMCYDDPCWTYNDAEISLV